MTKSPKFNADKDPYYPPHPSDIRDEFGAARAIALIGIITVIVGGVAYLSLHDASPSPTVAPVMPPPRPGPRAVFRFPHTGSCLLTVNAGGWTGMPFVGCEDSTKAVAACGPGHNNYWQWNANATQCGATRLGREDLENMFHQKWVVVAGDSITRYFFGGLLRAMGDGSEVIRYKHQSFEYVLPGHTRASFLWSPFASNLTKLFDGWATNGTMPDVLVMGVGLWHMLHQSGEVQDYRHQLLYLREAVERMIRAAHTPPLMFWFSITELACDKLGTEIKRERMTADKVDAYNLMIASSGLLQPHGPFHLVDIHHLTEGCGAECTSDGIHYTNSTYDTAFQVWANIVKLKPS